MRAGRARVRPYAVRGDDGEAEARWVAAPHAAGEFDLVVDDRAAGRWRTPLVGRHNLRNALAALILSHEGSGIPWETLREALPRFRGVRRRQQRIAGGAAGVTVYDDFAHHPTAVRETLEALRPGHAPGRLLAAFEPRSATACRRLHQERYVEAFDAAGMVVLAPVGRELPEDERLDTVLLAAQLNERGVRAVAAASLDEVVERITGWARPGDGVALLSNGGFGGIGARLAEAFG